jgi:hypothetical protein
VTKLLCWLLTEMLEVRILPGEPTPLSCNELRIFSGNSAIRRCDVECANHDQSRSIKTNKNQLGRVSLRFVRSIAANRDQTKHSALDRMLVGHDRFPGVEHRISNDARCESHRRTSRGARASICGRKTHVRKNCFLKCRNYFVRYRRGTKGPTFTKF